MLNDCLFTWMVNSNYEFRISFKSGLIFEWINFRSFRGFGAFPRNIICAKLKQSTKLNPREICQTHLLCQKHARKQHAFGYVSSEKLNPSEKSKCLGPRN